MPSPFPGMNPYLERRSVWHDFHDVFCMECRRALLPQIRPQFIATLDDNVYIHELPGEGLLLGGSDVSVIEHGVDVHEQKGGSAGDGAGVAAGGRAQGKLH